MSELKKSGVSVGTSEKIIKDLGHEQDKYLTTLLGGVEEKMKQIMQKPLFNTYHREPDFSTYYTKSSFSTYYRETPFNTYYHYYNSDYSHQLPRGNFFLSPPHALSSKAY
ncbi:MAG: hypothetical protein C0179_04280 [Fervidicoccus sp.]|nr:MAG: hypothetical protein C0179_04280 [Fervidicoccus sp.]